MALMKAAVFVEKNRIVVEEKPIPDIGPLDALLRITTTTICGTDVHILRGEYPVAKGLIVGHEPVGVIEKLGAQVQGLHEGQRVAFFPEGTTSRQGEVLPFHANLFEAAIDAKVAVQPYALSYVDVHGAFHRSVDYTGDTTFVDSLFTILEGEPVVAHLHPLAPIDATGAHRRELAEAAQESIGAILRRDM